MGVYLWFSRSERKETYAEVKCRDATQWDQPESAFIVRIVAITGTVRRVGGFSYRNKSVEENLIWRVAWYLLSGLGTFLDLDS